MSQWTQWISTLYVSQLTKHIQYNWGLYGSNIRYSGIGIELEQQVDFTNVITNCMWFHKSHVNISKKLIYCLVALVWSPTSSESV